MGRDGYAPLFETKAAKGRVPFTLFVVSVFTGICLICVYRVLHLPPSGDVARWPWIGIFMAELWFIFYWILTQIIRSNPVHRLTFKNRLSERHEKVLPRVDTFVCTADPTMEPPIMVISTVLSLMAYDYPPEKLSVYLSDDGGSELTFYALIEASEFSKYWLPFCKKYKVESRSPRVYFSADQQLSDEDQMAKEQSIIKKLYEDMKRRIEETTKLGRISDELRQHKGFREWDFVCSKRDHQTILQILIDGRDPKAIDVQGQPLPTLVYFSREKRPQYPHNYKAGALNALIRVSSRISNAPIILNVDCDMYANNSESVRDALCFFMDEEQGQEIAFVQFPQSFDNVTKNELYGTSIRIIFEVEFAGLDGHGGPTYVGTGCFHRREILCGKGYSKDYKIDWEKENNASINESAAVLEETCKVLASCTYEENTQWGYEIGVKYGCAVEDSITGLSILGKGWRSVYFNSKRKGFLGVVPTTLLQTLVQFKRWSEGDLEIFLSKYCPLVCGYRTMPLTLQLSQCVYLLWAPNCFPTLYYVTVPSLCILRGISLFPKLSSPWALPFAGVIIAKYAYSLREFLGCGGTFKGWWNDQRMWLFKRSTSYVFGFIDSIIKLLGIANSGFELTTKVADDDVSERYEKEVMEFGAPSPMFNIIATLALVNLFCFVGGVKSAITDSKKDILDQLALQILLSGVVVLINLPVYEGLFFRKDTGRMPTSVTYKSLILAISAILVTLY